MRIFILCTGRCGSTTMIKACKNITNYTADHESLVTKKGKERFAYPENHIEADNRLSWFLGRMNMLFGDDVFYVHLKRNRDKVAQSYARRFYSFDSIMDAFSKGILMSPPEQMNPNQLLQTSYDYVDTVTANIDLFLADKSNKMTLNVENWQEQFPRFWNRIGAEGDLKNALKELEKKHNSIKTHTGFFFKRRLKLYLTREWRYYNSIKEELKRNK
jgi:hypothetical protein